MALIVAIGLAMRIGFLAFLVMGLLILFGLIYAVPVILPARWQNLSALKIKDIPTSKTFSVPIAWATVTVIAPHLSSLPHAFVQMLYAFWVIFLTVLVRTALLDLLAVRGDRLVGRETLVVLVGERRTTYFIAGVLTLLAVSAVFGPSAGLSTGFAFALLPVTAAYSWQFSRCLKSRLREDPLCETLIESVLIGFGVLALLWLGIN